MLLRPNSVVAGRIKKLKFKDFTLGELEEVVLLTTLHCGDDAYLRFIGKSITKLFERKISEGSVHMTLSRLEKKGLLESHYSSPTKMRGGRRKRLFKATNSGLQYLDFVLERKLIIWEKLKRLKDESK